MSPTQPPHPASAAAVAQAMPQLVHALQAARPADAHAAMNGMGIWLQAIEAEVGANFHFLPVLLYLVPAAMVDIPTGNWVGFLAVFTAHATEIFPNVDLTALLAAAQNAPTPQP